MNRETRGNMCKNKLYLKETTPPKKQWESARAPNSSPHPLPLGGRKCPQIRGLRRQVLQRYPPPASRPIQGQSGRVPFPSRVGPGEGLLQVGETESGGGDARCWLWWKGHVRESPSAQVSRQKSEKQPRATLPPPRTPGVRRRGAGRGGVVAGPAVLHGRGKWGPSEW